MTELLVRWLIRAMWRYLHWQERRIRARAERLGMRIDPIRECSLRGYRQ